MTDLEILHRSSASPVERALALMRLLGMPHTGVPRRWGVPSTSDALFVWDGVTCHLGLLSDEGDASHLFHEVGHWLEASHRERALPDFGIGVAPESRYRGCDYTWSGEKAHARESESRASVAGIEMQWHLHLDWIWTYGEHSWDSDDAFEHYLTPRGTRLPPAVLKLTHFRPGLALAVRG